MDMVTSKPSIGKPVTFWQRVIEKRELGQAKEKDNSNQGRRNQGHRSPEHMLLRLKLQAFNREFDQQTVVDPQSSAEEYERYKLQENVHSRDDVRTLVRK